MSDKLLQEGKKTEVVLIRVMTGEMKECQICLEAGMMRYARSVKCSMRCFD